MTISTKYIVKKYIAFCNKNNIQVQTHQIYGALWCFRKENEENEENEENLQRGDKLRTKLRTKLRGGILADDMGMGKTIQMIATIFLNFRKKTLILLPPILIQQWYSEIFKILGHSATIYYKQNRNKVDLYNSHNMVIITSYDTFLRSPELLEITWDRTICDEAHRLRNPKTKLYKQIERLRTDILWCITGTPIHNKMKDVMSLFALYGVGKAEEDVYKNMILRRTKSTTNLLLPKKTETQEMISWSNPEEWKLAKDIHLSMYKSGGGGGDSFWSTKQTSELVTMIRAKQLCILPKLLEKPIQKFELDEPDDLFPMDFKYITKQNTSCKLTAIIQHILSRVNNGRGKIIFCHFQLEMTKIAELLREEIPSPNIWIGNWKEFGLFKKKNEGLKKTPILILQIRAGCEGLNLQHDFSEVYFVSPNWNPTLEEQAIARCHRIGQQNEVFVFRFYMDNLLYVSEKKAIEKDIRKYAWIINRIPEDVQRLVNEYLVSDNTHTPPNYSMDQYILLTQNKKREKITEFIDQITI